MIDRFIQLNSSSLKDPAVAEPFVKAVHRQVVANGGTLFHIDTQEQRDKCIRNMSLLMNNGFWEAWRLETEKSPVSALLLMKEGYRIDDKVIVRFEDVVTQPGLDRNGFVKKALLSGAAVAIDRFGHDVVISGEADEHALKPYVGKVYTDVGGVRTGEHTTRLNHNELQEFRDSFIPLGFVNSTYLMVHTTEGTQKFGLKEHNDHEAKLRLAEIASALPPSYSVALHYKGWKVAEASKEDRASIIRSATFDFDAPLVADLNESPIGSQINSYASFSDADDFETSVMAFRVLAQLMTEPQKSRNGSQLVLQQSFFDFAVNPDNYQHQNVVQYFKLPNNNYGGEGAEGVSQIYQRENPQLPENFARPQIVYLPK